MFRWHSLKGKLSKDKKKIEQTAIFLSFFYLKGFSGCSQRNRRSCIKLFYGMDSCSEKLHKIPQKATVSKSFLVNFQALDL